MAHKFKIRESSGLWYFECNCGKVQGVRGSMHEAVDDYFRHIPTRQNMVVEIEVGG